MGDCIKVAVRLRLFLPNDPKPRVLGVEMQGCETVITNPENNEDKKFAFNYSYWSFDKSEDHEFANNARIYNDLGKDILDNTINGFNSCLFAYGQTGSGKSYSMTGDGDKGKDPGIIQLVSRGIFNLIQEKSQVKDNGVEYVVQVAMLEIYCEAIRDLLNPKAGALECRLNPKSTVKGFWVPELTRVPVKSVSDVIKFMDLGFKNRSLTATKMNKTSSRAHTLFTIKLVQRKLNPMKNVKKSEKYLETSGEITLVDLAGSECLKNTGATGQAAKEGRAINLSLTSLGLVIDALAKKAKYAQKGKTGAKQAKKVRIPFRGSELTKLLKESLCGNSKTVMIAAVRPSKKFYQNTKKTLQFAKRASTVSTKPKKNENPTAQLIKKLKAEKKKLAEELEKYKSMAEGKGDPEKDALIEKLKQQLNDASTELDERKDEDDDDDDDGMTEEEKAELVQAELQKYLKENGYNDDASQDRKTSAHLLNLTEDPSLSGALFYILADDSATTVGSESSESCQVFIKGLNIMAKHCVINCKQSDKGQQLTLTAIEASKTFVNGVHVAETIPLEHGDRIIFGINHFYKVIIPKVAEAQRKLDEQDGKRDMESLDYIFAKKRIIEQAKTPTKN